MTVVSTVRFTNLASPSSVEDKIQEQVNRSFYQAITRHAGQIVDVDNSGVAANAEFAVPHGLGVVPTHVEILVHEGQSNHYMSIRPGGTAWTKTHIYLESNSTDANFRLRIVA